MLDWFYALASIVIVIGAPLMVCLSTVGECDEN